jgi:ubiquinone/menaquinone biosynthesis C-methylase UbiE
MKNNKENIRNAIRKNYSEVALKGSAGQCCSCGCSCDAALIDKKEAYTKLGYSEDDLLNAPSEANMGLGCGNPIAMAALKEGETVLDLGCGGGFDCFLASRRVGASGYVIGVDMTPDMIALARKNAEDAGYTNVDFRLGEIEHLPVADESVDVIISNCVINLSLDKEQVFKETYKALKPGGRLSISDVLATSIIPDKMRRDLQLVACCIAGAEHVDVVRIMLKNTGFSDIYLTPKENSREIIKSWGFGNNLEDYVASFIIEANKPVINEKRGEMIMKTLKIEWRHLDIEGDTCDRCYDTGENLANEVKRLKRTLEPQGIVIELTETKLDDNQIPQSNTVLFNGVPIEDILDIEVYDNYCESCTALLGKETYCRAVKFEGNDYDDIPAKAIRQAAYKALEIEEKQETSKNSGCCCSGNSGCCC